MQRMGSPQSSGPWPIRDKHRVSTNQSWVPSCPPIPAHLGSHGAVVAEPLLVRLDDLRPGPAHTTWSPHVAISLLFDQSDLYSTNFHFYSDQNSSPAKTGKDHRKGLKTSYRKRNAMKDALYRNTYHPKLPQAQMNDISRVSYTWGRGGGWWSALWLSSTGLSRWCRCWPHDPPDTDIGAAVTRVLLWARS